MKIICSNSAIRQFALDVFDFLSKHYSINLRSEDGQLFRIEGSPFGNRSLFSNVWRKDSELPDPITINGNKYYLNRNWYQDINGGVLCIFDNLRKYVRQITKVRYDIKQDSGEYILFEHMAVVLTTADNLIRADYTYMPSLHLSLGAMNAGCLDLTSTILASMGNVSFLALMDRIPVYIVDSRFMQEHFDEGNTHWESAIILKSILCLLEDIIDILQEKEDAEKLLYTIDKARIKIKKLSKFEKYERLILKIGNFLDDIEKWIEEYGVPGLRNPNFKPWLEGIIESIEIPPLSTEFLGVYCTAWRRNEYYEKAIFICWERIRECADHGHAIDLLTKVTIHEFCHAYMDMIAGSGRALKDVYHWMEESMANVLTLKTIENYVIKHPSAIELFDYAKSFMLKQPDAYAVAVRMWENGIFDYDMWAWHKDKCVASTSVKNWYNEMSAKWKTMPNDHIQELWANVKQEILGIGKGCCN